MSGLPFLFTSFNSEHVLITKIKAHSSHLYMLHLHFVYPLPMLDTVWQSACHITTHTHTYVHKGNAKTACYWRLYVKTKEMSCFILSFPSATFSLHSLSSCQMPSDFSHQSLPCLPGHLFPLCYLFLFHLHRSWWICDCLSKCKHCIIIKKDIMIFMGGVLWYYRIVLWITLLLQPLLSRPSLSHSCRNLWLS